MSALRKFDPIQSETIECPYAFHRALRQEAPVHQLPGACYYVVSRFADIQHVVMHPELFSSNLMATLMARPDGGAAMLDIRAQGHEQVDALALADPPVHTRQRKLVNKAFNVRRIAALEPAIRVLANRLVDGFAVRGRVEWMEQFAVPLPLTVIADLLSLPRADLDRLRLWSDGGAQLFSGVNTAEEFAELNRQMADFHQYLAEQFVRHCRKPGDDLIGDLVRATQDPAESLTHAEAVAILVQLVSAGNETTTSLIGAAVQRLLSERGALAAVRRDRSILANFIEETVRLESPFYGHFRVVMRDTVLGGVPLAAGARLMLLWSSGNRDEAQFRDADRFDPERANLASGRAFTTASGHRWHGWKPVWRSKHCWTGCRTSASRPTTIIGTCPACSSGACWCCNWSSIAPEGRAHRRATSAASVRAQEIGDALVHRDRLLCGVPVPRPRDDVELRARDALHEHVGILYREDDVLIAVHDQRGGAEGA
jgi:cytochrome P450